MKESSLFPRAFRVLRGRSQSTSEISEVQVSSFPFVSGDTFLQMAGYVFEDTAVLHRYGPNQDVCFVSGPVAIRSDFLDRTKRFLDEQEPGKFTLIIHNGDQIPTETVLEQLGGIFDRVYSVNVLSETSNVRALPIGLENARLNNNGRLTYYLEGLEEPRSNNRPRLVMSSFHVSNNPLVRQPTADIFRASRFGFDGHSWKRQEYRDVLKQTCFVISPPGNGPDCHRTWEAMYHKTIPVIETRHNLFQHVDLPILTVNSYHDFFKMPLDERLSLYHKIMSRGYPALYMDYWIELINKARNRN